LNKKTFSVILSNYNGGEHLHQSIQSVLDQTFEDFEFIIVDDGSKDNSNEIIKAFYKKFPNKIIPIFLKKNLGQANGFNEGIKIATGRLVSFIDSDDFWFPDKLQMVLKSFGDETKNAFHQHNLYFFRKNILTNIPFKDYLVSGNYGTYADKSRRMPVFIPTSGLSFRLDILKKVYPIPMDFKTCADGYLTRSSLAFGEVSSATFFGGAYRDHDNNSTFGNSKYNPSHYLHRILLPHLFEFYEENNISWRFGYATKEEYSKNLESINKLDLQNILVLRSASFELVEDLLSFLQKRTNKEIHFFTQPNTCEQFDQFNLQSYYSKEKYISLNTIKEKDKSALMEINFNAIFVPMSERHISAYQDIIDFCMEFNSDNIFFIMPDGNVVHLSRRK
jgi:glycosyltransferase involved in cell wall biosynthesis